MISAVRTGLAAKPASAVDIRSLVIKKGFVAGIDLALEQIRAWRPDPKQPEEAQRAAARDVLLLALDFAAKASDLLRQGAQQLIDGVLVGGGYVSVVLAAGLASSLVDHANALDRVRAPYRIFLPGDPAYQPDNRYLDRLSLRDLQATCVEILTAARKGFVRFDEFRASLLGRLATLGMTTTDLLGAVIDLATALAGALKDIARGAAAGISGLGWFLKILLYGLPVIAVGAGGYWVYKKVKAERHATA